MRNLITLFLFFVSYSGFCQDQEMLLKEAYSKKSDSLLHQFFSSWQKELKPNDVSTLNDTLKIANNIIGDIYSKDKSFSPIDKDKYILIDGRELRIEIAKEDSRTKEFADCFRELEKSKNSNNRKDSLRSLFYDLKWEAIKSHTIKRFNPVYKNHKVLYLDDYYDMILYDFSFRYGDNEKIQKFLKEKINSSLSERGFLSTFERIDKITLFISMKLAIVYWGADYCNGRRCYRLNEDNNTWEISFELYEVCE